MHSSPENRNGDSVDAVRREQSLKSLFDETSTASALVLPELENVSLSFQQLASLVQQAAQQLQSCGIKHGDVISLSLPNSLAFIVFFLAITRIGAIAAPFNPQFKPAEASEHLESSGSVLCIEAAGQSQLAEQQINVPLAKCSADTSTVSLSMLSDAHPAVGREDGASQHEALPSDPALLLYTSGTTGKPKAVPLTQSNLMLGAANVKDTYNLDASDRGLLIMPLFHIHGIVAGLLAPLFAGGSIVVSSSILPTFWSLLESTGANWFTGTPTMHKLALKLSPPTQKPRIRFARSCSSPLAPDTLLELEKLYGCPVIEAYAMTEASHQMTSNSLAGRQIDTVGKPTGVDLVILNNDLNAVAAGEKGEICVRGPTVMPGYRNNEEGNRTSFTNEGFFRTGDQGIQLPDGSIRITGRLKELINKGGEKISPVEIDNLFSAHEAISEAVAFAQPDDIYGEEIAVAVTCHPGKQITERDLKKWARSRVSAHKVPGKFFFPEVIPKTATGKLQRLTVATTMLEQG